MAEIRSKLKASEGGGKKAPMAAAKRRGRASGPSDGAERLRRAVNQRVAKNSNQLADVFTEKALHGDVASARVLLALAGSTRPATGPGKKRPPSVARLLALEPQWEGPMEEEGNEVGPGMRE